MTATLNIESAFCTRRRKIDQKHNVMTCLAKLDPSLSLSFCGSKDFAGVCVRSIDPRRASTVLKVRLANTPSDDPQTIFETVNSVLSRFNDPEPDKRKGYPELFEFALIDFASSIAEMRVELYRKGLEGWSFVGQYESGDQFDLASVGLTVRVDDLYGDTYLPDFGNGN